MEYSTGHDHLDEHEELFKFISMLDKAIATNKRLSLVPL